MGVLPGFTPSHGVGANIDAVLAEMLPVLPVRLLPILLYDRLLSKLARKALATLIS